MKKGLGLFVLLAVLSGCTKKVAATPPAGLPNSDFKITGSWTYDFSNFPPCSSTVTKSCISGFNWGYTDPISKINVQLQNLNTSICSGATPPEICSVQMNSTLPMGTFSFWAEATTVDASGTASVGPVGSSNSVTAQASAPVLGAFAIQ